MSQKVVIVTGAGSGIGQAIAVGFARRGAAIVAIGRDASKLETTSKMVLNAGGKCMIQSADVADAEGFGAAIAAADAEFHRVDVLVNNAAQAVCAGLEELDLDEFDSMLRANCAGVLYGCRHVWPIMKRQQGGVIINISSVASQDPFAGLAAYGATKAFVNLLTKGLAEEGRPHGIAVFGIGPGAVETDMLRGAFPDYPAEDALDPKAVAELAATLATEALRFSTGQTIYIRK